MTRVTHRMLIGLALLAAVAGLVLFFRHPELRRLASTTQDEVAEIRGREFVTPVVARYGTREERNSFVEEQLSRIPVAADYGKVVRMLGLYTGPPIGDARALLRQLITSTPEGSVGYYDEKRDIVFVEKDARGSIRLGGLAHEIYHAFQDQHFNLGSYLVEKSFDGSLDADEVMARHAVVEGEATYVGILWEAQRAAGNVPVQQAVTEAVKRRSEVDREALVALLGQQNASPQSRAMLAVLEQTPAFVFDGLFGSYQHGVAFISAVQREGWDEVEKLYSEYPPESTEQILHPEKWFARERPVKVTWPAFDADPLFADWKLLAENVLGESQWRMVFKEQGLGDEAAALAQGWGGDRYAVFERAGDGALLLLWHTTWDTPGDAAEFADAYRGLLQKKYAGMLPPVRVNERGQDVLIVEGGDDASIDAFMDFVERVR